MKSYQGFESRWMYIEKKNLFRQSALFPEESSYK